MTPNQWWLRLTMPTGTHMFWLSNDGYDNDTAFTAQIDQASALLDFPNNWYDREDGPWERSLSEDPHPSIFTTATVHDEGWFDDGPGE